MYLRFFLPLIAIVAFCAANYSCSKSPSSSTPHTDNLPKDTSSIIVYVAGDTTIDDWSNAVYWKNGVMIKLPVGHVAAATSIFVYNKDVYVSARGSTHADSVDYWKNDQAIVLPDTIGSDHATYSITTWGGEVYATGGEVENPDFNEGAVYWKNNGAGVRLVPLASTIHQSRGIAIAVSNSGVYIAGFLDAKAVYWKDGTAFTLPIDTPFIYNPSIANSVCLNQGDVYFAGTINLTQGGYTPSAQSIATYWKNDVPVRLTRDTGSVATAIAIAGNDIYVAGGIVGSDGLTRAAYWKNGKLFMLNSSYSIANAMTIYGTDVYIAGTINEDLAIYWKNGVPVYLGAGRAWAIFVDHK